MKALIKVLFVTAIASIAIVGCGDKGGGSNAFNGQQPGFPFGPNGTGDQFRGSVSISDRNLYHQYLEDSRLCSQDMFGFIGNVNGCKWMDKPPFIAISFQAREAVNNWGLPAQVMFDVISDWGNAPMRNTGGCHQYNPGYGSQWGQQWGQQQAYPQQGGQQGCSVSFYNINNNSQLEATMYTASGQVHIVMIGSPADNQVQVELRYRNKAMGTATLNRIPGYGYGFPYQPPYQPYYR